MPSSRTTLILPPFVWPAVDVAEHTPAPARRASRSPPGELSVEPGEQQGDGFEGGDRRPEARAAEDPSGGALRGARAERADVEDLFAGRRRGREGRERDRQR